MSLIIEHQVLINCPREKVWKILTDFKNYKTWNPFLINVERLDSQRLRVVAKSGDSYQEFKPFVVKEVPNQELRWVGKLFDLPFLFTGEHFFILKEDGQKTQFTHGEKFSGILAYLLWPFINKSIAANFNNLETALKKVAES